MLLIITNHNNSIKFSCSLIIGFTLFIVTNCFCLNHVCSAQSLPVIYDKNVSYVQSSSKITQTNKTVKTKSKTNSITVISNKNRVKIPILMYHSIAYEKDNILRVPKEIFEKQMKFIKDSGYTTLSLNELYNFMQNDTPVSKKSVVITFDDGYVDNYTNAYPVLKELGLKATVFVIVNTIDKDKNYLTSEQLKIMDKNGINIESHTLSHEDLSKLTYEQQLYTLTHSKESLEKLLYKEIKYFAYPYGSCNNDTIKAIKKCEYTLAVTTAGGFASKEDGIYTLSRVFISGSASMKEFERRLTNPNYNKN